ncbi:hypothetical protein [Luteolibacter luteus]|uniref:Uncharacterized protein n=1 Tax=Luteolibacter luteus TaxID=2728835 RepID=A0A858RC44_9BACT|nr:hypothetical protein [Luteolibacter luteus]QJE94596.1 hypothetical protein HHL09_01955 [Luteolibacter luteus]
MLYLVHAGTVISTASELEPAYPGRWQRGQILYFSINSEPLDDNIEEAALMNSSGELWHVEILTSSHPRNRDSPALSGVVARVLRKLEADAALLSLLPQRPKISAFPLTREYAA